MCYILPFTFDNGPSRSLSRLTRAFAFFIHSFTSSIYVCLVVSVLTVHVFLGSTQTLSSAQPTKKAVEQVALPPMQISALPPATAQRVASLKSTSSSSLSSTQSMPKAPTSSSRITQQTVSSMQKHSDSSLRSRHQQLPTIAGSPSVGSGSHGSMREPKEGPPSSSLNVSSALSKETPTKIPRISSRSSATNSPTLKGNRRTSTLIGTSSGISNSRNASPSAGNDSMNEFGVLETGNTSKSGQQRYSVRASPSTATTTATSRVPRQVSTNSSSTVNGTSRKNRESISFSGLRKSSTGSVASISVNPPPESQPAPSSSHRFSALSPSKGLKLLSPKALSSSRVASSSSQGLRDSVASPNSSRQSLSTPSPSPSSVDEEELLGDEEMLQYIKRQHAKKLATGVSQEELNETLKFPEPTPPMPPMSPNG